MAAPTNDSPKYWLLKTEGVDFKEHKQIMLTTDAEIEPDEIVYFWQEVEEYRVHAWGRMIDPPKYELAEPVLRYVRAEIRNRINPPIRQSELQNDPVLRTLAESVDSYPTAHQLRDMEVVALNRLISLSGIKPPPNPLVAATKSSSSKAPSKRPSSKKKAVKAPIRKQVEVEEAASEPSSTTESPSTVDDNLKSLQAIFQEYSFLYIAGVALRKAGEFAAKRSRQHNKLTSSCILFGMAESGRIELGSGNMNAASFLYEWLTKNNPETYENAFSQFLPEAERTRNRAASSAEAIKLTNNATKIVKRAAEIASITTGQATIHGRHLLGTFLEETAANQIGATSRLEEMRIDFLALRRAFFSKFIDDPATLEDEIQKWREILPQEVTSPERGEDDKQPPPTAEPLKPFLPRIDADDLKGDDYLSIKPELKAFASIISARDVKTPLSIGLFGDWGSGKSFFMSKLKEEVNTIASAVREKPGEKTAYYGNIVQIDFNAWHYVEAHLWASLVSHIFDNLSFSDEKNRKMAEVRKNLLLAQLETTLKAQKEAATAAVEKDKKLQEKVDALTTAQTDLDNKKAELDTKRGELETKLGEHHTARLSLRKLLRAGIWAKVKKNPQVEEHLKKIQNLLKSKGLPTDEREIKEQVAATQTVIGRAQMIFWSIVKDPYAWLKVLLLVALFVLIPLAITLILSWMQTSENWKALFASASKALTLLGGAYAWLKLRLKEADKTIGELEKAHAELDTLYKDAKQEFDDDRAQLQTEIDQKRAEIEKGKIEIEKRKDAITNAREELEKAQKAFEASRKEVEQTQATLKEMEPGRMLARFIEDRASSSDYRQHLGVIALIRRDFKELSELLAGQGDDKLKKAVAEILQKYDAQGQADPEKVTDEELQEYKIDRIVLYIDDLDRCPPKQVVEVLQAIHLLLAFELFVVIVGVDARWVRYSLKEQYPNLLTDDLEEEEEQSHIKAASPRDYVEKIFQVPYWIKPMNPATSTKFLDGLIPESEILTTAVHAEVASGPTQAERGAAAGASTPRVASRGVGGNGQPLSVVGGGTPAESSQTPPPVTETPGSGAGTSEEANAPEKSHAEEQEPAQQEQKKKEAPDLLPGNLKLEGKEKRAMMAMAKVIGRTPRTLKRFVNIYRIIKASLDEPQLKAFKGAGEADGEFRAVLVLLGVAHGSPEVAPVFFRKLKARYEHAAETNDDFGLKAFLNELKDSSLQNAPQEWTALIEELLEFVASHEDDISLEVLKHWAPTVVRYTFQLGRMSEIV